MASITIRLSDYEKEQLQELAKRKDLTMSQILRKAIRLITLEDKDKREQIKR